MGNSVFRAVLVAGAIAIALGSRVAAQAPGASSAAASGSAWTLDAVLVAALSQHPLVEATRAQVTAAEGGRHTAGALPNPVATYWVENARFPGQGTSSSLEAETSAYGTLPLEPLLQRRARMARADADVEVARATQTTAERRVAADVAHAFYRLAVAQVSLDAMQENQTAIERLVEYLRNRVSQGATPEGELIRTEVERDRGEADATLAEVEVARAASALRPYLGDRGPVGAVRVAAPEWMAPAAALPPLADLATHALAVRPELVASRAKVQAASGALAIERSLKVRQLGATFGVKRTLGVNAMVAGLSVTVPLFDRNRGEIQRATAERLAAEQETRWLERAVAGEVEAEYLAASRLIPRVSSLQSTFVRRAEESRRIAIGAYEEGAASLLQVLDAARAAGEARLSYARLVAAAAESTFTLGLASGYDATTAARIGRGESPSATGLPANGGSR